MAQRLVQQFQILLLVLCSLPALAGPLHQAVRAGYVDRVHYLVDEEEVDIEESENGKTALQLARELNLFGIVSFLKERETQARLLCQLPQTFQGRSKAVFERQFVRKSKTLATMHPYVKVKYQSQTAPFTVIWLYALDLGDMKNEREFLEVQSSTEPRLLFESASLGERLVDNAFRFTAKLGPDGLMSIWAQTQTARERSEFLNAAKEYQNSLAYFGADRVLGISAFWPSAFGMTTNLAAFNKAIGRRMPALLAVFETHEGKQAKKLGFTQVSLGDGTEKQLRDKALGPCSDVCVFFRRPKG